MVLFPLKLLIIFFFPNAIKYISNIKINFLIILLFIVLCSVKLFKKLGLEIELSVVMAFIDVRFKSKGFNFCDKEKSLIFIFFVFNKIFILSHNCLVFFIFKFITIFNISFLVWHNNNKSFIVKKSIIY